MDKRQPPELSYCPCCLDIWQLGRALAFFKVAFLTFFQRELHTHNYLMTFRNRWKTPILQCDQQLTKPCDEESPPSSFDKHHIATPGAPTINKNNKTFDKLDGVRTVLSSLLRLPYVF